MSDALWGSVEALRNAQRISRYTVETDGGEKYIVYSETAFDIGQCVVLRVRQDSLREFYLEPHKSSLEAADCKP